MKKKMIRNLVVVIITVVMLLSCDLLFGNKSSEPVFNTPILWKTEIYVPSTMKREIFSIGENFYLLTEDFKGGKIEDWRTDNYFLTVINKNTHKATNIKLDINKGSRNMQKIEIDNTVYIFLFTGSAGQPIDVYSTKDNTIKACIKLSDSNDSSLQPRFYTCTHNNKIIWYSGYYHAMFQLDTSKIDFSKGPDEIQLIEPEKLFDVPDDYRAYTKPIVKDNILYYVLENTKVFQDDQGFIGAFDLDTNTKIWEIKPGISGCHSNSLLFCNDLLVYIDSKGGLISLDSKTGEILNLVKKLPNGGPVRMPAWSAGAYYYDGLIYFCTGLGYSDYKYLYLPKESVKALMCFDPHTATYKWGDMPDGLYSFRPLAYNDKVYFPSAGALRVYNAKTGSLIGVDTDFCCHESMNLIEGDTMYFLQGKGKSSYFVAVKAE